MSKSTSTCWNALATAEEHRWRWIEGLEGQVQELILSHDASSGAITRLTRFMPMTLPSGCGWSQGTTPAAPRGKCTVPFAAIRDAWCWICPSRSAPDTTQITLSP